jgi:hypothetical protein
MRPKIKVQANLLFKNAPDRSAEVRENPVTGGRFVAGVDPVRPQKLKAQSALEARESFKAQKSDDAPDLPLTYAERERSKVDGLPYIVSLFARSLACRDYEMEGHPSFDVYARGVMASDMTPMFIREDAQLLRRYPPVPLNGMGPGLMWRGP